MQAHTLQSQIILHPLTSAEPLPVSLMGVYNVSERFLILNLSPKYQSVSDDYCIEKIVELFRWHLKNCSTGITIAQLKVTGLLKVYGRHKDKCGRVAISG